MLFLNMQINFLNVENFNLEEICLTSDVSTSSKRKPQVCTCPHMCTRFMCVCIYISTSKCISKHVFVCLFLFLAKGYNFSSWFWPCGSSGSTVSHYLLQTVTGITGELKDCCVWKTLLRICNDIFSITVNLTKLVRYFSEVVKCLRSELSFYAWSTLTGSDFICQKKK